MSQSRPNILCIVSEDCPPWNGTYGDPIARTPNLDRLARDGVAWRVANCTAPVCAPSRFAILTGRHAEAVPPAQHMAAFGPFPPGIATYPDLFRAAGYYCTNNSKTHYNTDLDPAQIWDETSDTAHWRNRPAEAPFLAVFNTMLTHESCTFAPKDGPTDPDAVRIPSYLPDTPGMRESLARYYNQIARMDAFMGERLAELEADGVAENTIVFYYSDHGSPLPRSKRFCYDEGLGVPMIVRVPERWRHLLAHDPGTIVENAPVSLVDLMPTQLTIAGIALPAGLHGQAFLGAGAAARTYVFGGRDRMDERYDFTRTARSARYRYIRNYAPHRIWGQHYAFAWEGQHYKDYEAAHLAGTLNAAQDRFWHAKPSEEFYDMAVDPDAVHNLIGDPAHAQAIAAHRAALDAHMLEVRDCGFIPEGSPLEHWAAHENDDAYPLADIMELASRAIARQAENVPLFRDRLSSDNPIIRYWAAQGLLMLAIAGTPIGDLEEALAGENGPTVWIALAEAAGHDGHADRHAEALVTFVRGTTQKRLQLQALNALTALEHTASISLPLAQDLAEDDDEYVRGAAGYLAARLTGAYTPESQIFRFDLFKPTGHSGLTGRTFPRL
ncbi:sulfatase-like hydrolase/transferase [Devosia sp. PTR5]|uniref:Sulfatase-like hydrolase/transferase n=1 Tax=Devosia oryzisoli TaxID=2774138 RepID=A0A927FW80_9HYPH|nr:sulfatase-like hydrolase/transferase [Devosia oryzisoli]MBD8065983.1 sulfatase-like hydrolase/transferase [Devosia oryzisoli]